MCPGLGAFDTVANPAVPMARRHALEMNFMKSFFLSRTRRLLTSLVLALSLLVSATTLAATPTQFIQGTTDQVSGILSRPESPGRSDELQKAVEGAVDFREMASRALGKHWNARSQAEQTEFLELLQRMLQASYAQKLQGYQLGKDYAVTYGKERLREGRATVPTTVSRGKESYPVVYRLMDKGGQWVIYDIIIDEISLEETYRDGYVPIIEKNGWPTLVSRMKERIAELESKAPAKSSKSAKGKSSRKK